MLYRLSHQGSPPKGWSLSPLMRERTSRNLECKGAFKIKSLDFLISLIGKVSTKKIANYDTTQWLRQTPNPSLLSPYPTAHSMTPGCLFMHLPRTSEAFLHPSIHPSILPLTHSTLSSTSHSWVMPGVVQEHKKMTQTTSHPVPCTPHSWEEKAYRHEKYTPAWYDES